MGRKVKTNAMLQVASDAVLWSKHLHSCDSSLPARLVMHMQVHISDGHTHSHLAFVWDLPVACRQRKLSTPAA